MLKKVVQVKGFVRNHRTGLADPTFPEGVAVEMISSDSRTWFMKPSSMLRQRMRKVETPKFTVDELRWIDQLEGGWQDRDAQ